MLFGGMPALVLTCRRADRQMSRHVGCVSAFGGKCHDISRTWREPDLWQMSKKKSRHSRKGQRSPSRTTYSRSLKKNETLSDEALTRTRRERTAPCIGAAGPSSG